MQRHFVQGEWNPSYSSQKHVSCVCRKSCWTCSNTVNAVKGLIERRGGGCACRAEGHVNLDQGYGCDQREQSPFSCTEIKTVLTEAEQHKVSGDQRWQRSLWCKSRMQAPAEPHCCVTADSIWPSSIDCHFHSQIIIFCGCAQNASTII